jgi:phosphoglycolate phosphatase-like HAD superfamily hydrolase
MKLEYLFLDLDGTLLEDKFRHYFCYRDILETMGGKPLDIETYWNLKRNKMRQQEILQVSSFQGDQDTFYWEWVSRIEEQSYLRYARLKPRVIETLEEWKQFCEKMVLLSMRNSFDNLIWQLKETGLYSFFDEVLHCSPLIKYGKYNVLKNITFSFAVFIGDSEEDMKPAKMLGMKTIAVTNGIRDPKYLLADYYVEELCYVDLKKVIEDCGIEGMKA